MKTIAKTKTATPKHKGITKKVVKNAPVMKGKMKTMRRSGKGHMC